MKDIQPVKFIASDVVVFVIPSSWTVNAVDPEILKEINGFIVYEGKAYKGLEAAEILKNANIKNIITASNLEDGAKKAVAAAKGEMVWVF